MRAYRWLAGVILYGLAWAAPVQAEFIISSAIVEFTAGGPRQKDIELISRSPAGQNDYLVTEISEIRNPGSAQEQREALSDPEEAGLLVSPDKTILAGGARKVLRFVLLQEPAEQERVFRVAVKPVIRGVGHTAQVGLKVLVGYEVLVIVRPAAMNVNYWAKRMGDRLQIVNHGNTNVLLQNGQQCSDGGACKLLQVMRVYPGETVESRLPLPGPASYLVWDGTHSEQKQF